MLKHMPPAAYNALPGIRASQLKRLATSSPMHMHWDAEHPKDTDAMRMGRLVHVLALEPENAAERFAVADKPDCRNGANKKYWDALIAENTLAGRDVFSSEEYAQAQETVAALRDHAAAREWLFEAAGESEVTVQWSEEIEIGQELITVPCKARLDRLITISNTIIDIKTCRDASPGGFQRQARNLRYDIQAIHYMRGLAATEGVPVEEIEFLMIAVETEPPHGISLHVIAPPDPDDPDRERSAYAKGLKRWQRAMQEYVACEQSGNWPGYPSIIHEMLAEPWE